MSKQINRNLALLLAFAVTLTAVLFGGPASAQHPATPTVSARQAAVIATTAAVLEETSEIRQLAILRPVNSGTQTRPEIERMVVRNLEEQTTPAEMEATELLLRKLGLAPPDFQYRPFIIKLLTEQVAGYYDTKTRQFFLADWIELEGQKPVMAHELTHALQDQHFNLRRFEKWPKGDADAELAAHALIEGDATLAMTLYMAKNPLIALAFVRSVGSSALSSEQFKRAPRALRESLVFPYERGREWATRLYQTGGWAEVSAAYSRLPQSTEQILHPEKYFSKEPPIRVTIPALNNLLGSYWKRLDYDVNGEWSYYLILDEFLKSDSESKRAAAGWGGDRYALYKGPQPRDIFVAQVSEWDNAEEAQQFFDSYAKRTIKRYPDAQPRTDIASAGGQTSSVKAWTTDEGGVIISMRGKRVVILEGIPGTAKEKELVRILGG